ncbi:conjugal transfer protein [Kosakonia radicincitans UMEnt01/12]|uniref:relaxosome protein TraM n=1 Tax=Kosakonia radicincitans TaxID=283686 RepID=UPI000461F2FF|nr:relaxosome protein TraM [Kosakonia radicincitans]KDE33534.1 conjugal transfer protein [Kosakonia radicincitans UMEnt01/12]
MPRKNIYFKDKIDREIEDIIEIEKQKGANASDVSYSSMVNELVRLGLMVQKSREESNGFDLEGYRRDLISKVSGTREGIMILTTLLLEIYFKGNYNNPEITLDELLNQSISAINKAESDAESHHFVTEEN